MTSIANDTPCVLIIAPHGSYRTFDFIQAAEKLGVTTLIASEGKHSIISAYAQGIHLDFTADSETIFQQLKLAIATSNITAVIATDDYTTELAARIAKDLDLPHNDPTSVKLTQRKDLARDRLAQHHISKPDHFRLDLEKNIQSQIEKLDYPVVVKPVGLSASRGVIRTNNQVELLDAVARIQNLLNSMNDLDVDIKRYLLVEEFIPGMEVAVEAMLTDGYLRILTIFDKPDPLEGPFFEETYYITPTSLDNQVQEQVRKVLEAACQAYGLSEGPIHAECRLNQRGVFVIEIAARTIGGLCGRLLSFGTGRQLEELVLLQAMRRPLELQQHELAAGVLMIPIPKAGVLKRVEGLLEAQRVPYVDEINIQIREGHELIPLPEGASYLGFIFAHAPTTQEAELALREAHAKLKFVIAPIWKLEAGETGLPGTSSNNHQPQPIHQVN
jgi:biotin carboxylase